MTATELRAIRTRLGISQEKLARRLGVTLNAVQKWEYGDRPISGPVEIAVYTVEAMIRQERQEATR